MKESLVLGFLGGVLGGFRGLGWSDIDSWGKFNVDHHEKAPDKISIFSYQNKGVLAGFGGLGGSDFIS